MAGEGLQFVWNSYKRPYIKEKFSWEKKETKKPQGFQWRWINQSYNFEQLKRVLSIFFTLASKHLTGAYMIYCPYAIWLADESGFFFTLRCHLKIKWGDHGQINDTAES